MTSLVRRSRTSTGAAALFGTTFGFVAVGVYLGAGVLVADWSIGSFVAHLSVDSLVYFLGTIAMAVGVVGLPIALFVRFDLTAPLVVLVLVVLGWLTIGVVQGVLSLETGFGLALYAGLLSPLYLGLYGVLGGGEYLLRKRVTGR